MTALDAASNRPKDPDNVTEKTVTEQAHRPPACAAVRAAQREDGAIELAPNLKGGAADKAVGTPLTQGLIEEIPARGALPIWRRDGGKGSFAVRITNRAARAGHGVYTWGSFADEEYYGINAFVFVNNKGHAGVMPDGGSYNSKIRRAQQDQP